MGPYSGLKRFLRAFGGCQKQTAAKARNGFICLGTRRTEKEQGARNLVRQVSVIHASNALLMLPRLFCGMPRGFAEIRHQFEKKGSSFCMEKHVLQTEKAIPHRMGTGIVNE